MDYFSLHGHNYLAVADRYSGWLTVYRVGRGEFDGETLVKKLREHFVTFGVACEAASDGGPQMICHEVQSFLKRWGVHHRLSSAYFPHSNNRAELAVKTAKRLLMENMDNQGGIDTDAFGQAMLQYRNTPHPDTRLSPAQVIFGRAIRDFVPVLPYKYEPRQEWGFLQEDRERALAKRMYHDGSRLAIGTRPLPPLTVGDKVLVQNQTGRDPTRWDKSGEIVEVLPHDQVNVLMHGSRRISLRNRRFVRKYVVPPIMPSQVKTAQYAREPVTPPPPAKYGKPEVTVEDHPRLLAHEEVHSHEVPEDNGHAVEFNEDRGVSPADQMMPRGQHDSADRGSPGVAEGGVRKSGRVRKPNSLFSPDVYELDSISAIPTHALEMPISGKENGSDGFWWPV